jgi:hypothetical protein
MTLMIGTIVWSNIPPFRFSKTRSECTRIAFDRDIVKGNDKQKLHPDK